MGKKKTKKKPKNKNKKNKEITMSWLYLEKWLEIAVPVNKLQNI